MSEVAVVRKVRKVVTIPSAHTGASYHAVLADLSAKRRVKRYLEIGVEAGVLLSQIHAETAVGVDPAFKISSNVSAHKKRLSLVQAASDEFFSEHDPKKLLGGSPDLAFLDGMHTFEFLLRDFYKTEAISDSNTLIGMHDCLPLTDTMALRSAGEAHARSQGTPFHNWWTGDVWKIIPILRKYRPDLKLVYVNAPPTGLVFVTNLDPSSRVLSDNYNKIVDEFSNDGASIANLYGAIELTQTSSLMNGFDNTLYFRT